MNSKKIVSLCLVLAMLLSLLAGCGGKADTNSQANASKTEDVSSTTPEASQGPAEQGWIGSILDNTLTADQVETGERSVLNVAVSEDCIDFDPFTGFAGTGPIFTSIYQGLAYPVHGELVNCMMKDYTMSDDGLTIDIEIFDYITDSEGNNITSSDVVWSYQMSEEYAFLGMKGYVDSFTATGDYTVQIKLKMPLGVGKIDKLMCFQIVSEKAYNEHDMSVDPVGTGRYVLTEHTSGYSMTLEKREDYWKTDPSLMSVQEMANVDTMNFYVVGESTQRTIALKNGTVDASESISGDDLDYFDASEDFWLAGVADDLSMCLEPNCDPSRPTGDVNLRKAIFYAISNEAILESVYQGRGTVMHDWCPSWAVGYNPDWDLETDNYYTYDVEKAKEYLEKSSYNGETLVILTMSNATTGNVAALISSMLEQVGIKTTINSLDGSIVRQTFADVNAWDLYLTDAATNTYWIDAVNGLLTMDKCTWEGSPNFWYDMELQDMLREYMQVENATPENFEILRDYMMENALGYAMVNPLTYFVVPSWCTGVSISAKKAMVSGANAYLPE